jgi:hypothetical protein
MSLKYTFSADRLMETPSEKMKSNTNISGTYMIVEDMGTLKINMNTINTTDSNRLMSNAVIHEEITKISLGK